ncbi:MAG: DUF58 domain-containing protein [bacterium]|nr:DUF58 domain-containing protein [bacterium]
MEEYRGDLEAGERAAARYALALPRNSALGINGARAGRRAGSSLEFQEHREYQPGDDLRHLDWSAYARSDRLIVKLYREEIQPHLDLLLDGSRSMALPGSVKAGAAAGLASFLIRAASQAGLTHGTWLAGEGCRPLGTAGTGSVSWQNLAFGHRGSLAGSLDRMPPRWRSRGIRVLVSDLLWGDEPRTVLSRLARGSAAVWVIQLLASADVDPAADGFGRLEDLETGERRDLLIDREALTRYRSAFEAHRESWRRACREVGAPMVTLVAEELVPGWPPESLEELVRHGMLEAA